MNDNDTGDGCALAVLFGIFALAVFIVVFVGGGLAWLGG
jgi:hypothetical protein